MCTNPFVEGYNAKGWSVTNSLSLLNSPHWLSGSALVPVGAVMTASSAQDTTKQAHAAENKVSAFIFSPRCSTPFSEYAS